MKMLPGRAPAPSMIVHSEEPYNAEPPLSILCNEFSTGQPDFYVRSHGNVPNLDVNDFRLNVGGILSSPASFTLEDLMTKFPAETVTSVLQCAGNRRADMHAVKPVSGDPRDAAAIGNARWTGIRLADVLLACGCEKSAEHHVEFTSEDDIEIEGDRFKFTVSVSLEKAFSPKVLLAWGINGEPLSHEHGFPLRAIVPGYAGIRSAKWLTGVSVISAPSDGHMQSKDYKLFTPSSSKGDEDWENAITINELPLNCGICEPSNDAELNAGISKVRGWAMASGASRVARIDVSCDGGRTWKQAKLTEDTRNPWAWTQWEIAVDLPPGDTEIVARAWDDAGQTQPAEASDLWNFKGYLSAAWHRIRVRVRR